MEFEGNSEIEQLEKSQTAEIEHKKVIFYYFLWLDLKKFLY